VKKINKNSFSCHSSLKLQYMHLFCKKPIKTNFYIEGPFRQNDCKWLKNLILSVLQIGFFHLLWLIALCTRINMIWESKRFCTNDNVNCRIASCNPSYDQNLPFPDCTIVFHYFVSDYESRRRIFKTLVCPAKTY